MDHYKRGYRKPENKREIGRERGDIDREKKKKGHESGKIDLE